MINQKKRFLGREWVKMLFGKLECRLSTAPEYRLAEPKLIVTPRSA